MLLATGCAMARAHDVGSPATSGSVRTVNLEPARTVNVRAELAACPGAPPRFEQPPVQSRALGLLLQSEGRPAGLPALEGLPARTG